MIVKILLKYGANVNEKRNSEGPVLWEVIDDNANVNKEMLKILLDAGADINATNYYKKTMLMHILRDYDYRKKVKSETVKLLLDFGAKINLRDSDGKTELMIAAEYSSAAVIRTLLNAGAAVNASNNGITPLMYAAKYNTTDVVNVLLNAGANINAKDKDGQKAVDYAKPNHFG